MSKIVKTVIVVAIAAAVVVFAPQIAAVLASVAGSIGITVTAAVLTSTLIGMGISLALTATMSLFRKTPSMSQSMVDRLNTSVVPTAARKIIFGTTAGGSDVRFFEGEIDLPSTKKDGYVQVVALASHRINALKQFYVETDLVWQDGSFVAKREGFAPNNPFRVVTEGRPGNGFPVGSGRYWNVSASFTGCAYYVPFWKLDEEVWESGIPQRLTAVVEGCPLYDPRRDSTRGGSGAHRFDSQDTWAFRDGSVEIGRNPALALLTYLIGWSINGKLVWGMGIPASRIDFDNFRTYANLCEERVATLDGTTVQRYMADGIYSTSDSHDTVINSLTAAMGSCKLTDRGGTYNIVGGYDDTAGPKVAFDADDLVAPANGSSPYVWNPAPASRERFNIVRGRFADPANLYQLSDWGDPIEQPALADGVPRTLSLDLGAVSRAETCQRIAKQFLLREYLCPGMFSATFGPKAFAVEIGSVITLSLPSEGWNNKLFRVMDQAETHDLFFQMTLREEDPAIYAWDREEKPLPVSIRPQGYDPTATIMPADLALTSASYAGANGVNVSEVNVNWTPELSGRVSGIQIQSRPEGSEAWSEQAALFDPKIGTFTFTSNAPGITVEVRARFRMSNAVYSPWVLANVATAPVTIVADWHNVTDNAGTRPEDNATVGAPEGTDVAGVPAETVVDNAQTAVNAVKKPDGTIIKSVDLLSSVSNLQITYGDTVSSKAYADAAAGYATTAGTAKTNTEKAFQDAATARDAGQAASATALGARDAALAAKGASETAFAQADAAKASAVGAKATAETARDQSIAAKADSQAARDVANAAQADALKQASAALASQGAAAISASKANGSKNDAGEFASAAQASVVAAQTARDASKGSADASAISASGASTSRDQAGQKAAAALQSETNATTSAGQALGYAGAAKTSSEQAAGSASNAQGSASSASLSQEAAARSAGLAGGSADAAARSAQTASTKADESGQSASASSLSSVNAASSYSAANKAALDAAAAAVNENRVPGASPTTWSYNDFNTFVPSTRLPAVDTGPFSYVAGQLLVAGTAHIHPITPTRLVNNHRYRATVNFRLLTDGTQDGNHVLFCTFWDSNGNLLMGNTVSVANLATTTVAAGAQTLTVVMSSNGVAGSSPWPASAVSARVMFRTASGVTTKITSLYMEDVEAQLAAMESANAAVVSASTASTKAGEAGLSAEAAQTSYTNANTARGQAQGFAATAAGSADTAAGSASQAAQSAGVAAGSKTDAETAREAAKGSSDAAAGSAQTANTRAGNADTSAIASQTSAVNAASSFQAANQTVAASFPSEFSQGSKFFTNQPTGQFPPDTVQGAYLNSGGPVYQVSNENAVLLPKGYFKAIPGRRYRFTAVVRSLVDPTSGPTGFGVDFNAPLGAMFNAAPQLNGTHASVPGIGNTMSIPASAGWTTIAVDFIPSDPANPSNRPRLFSYAPSPAGAVWQVRSLLFEDVTAVTAATASATAAATSASSAKTQADASSSSAKASNDSAVLAGTNAGNAQTSARNAVASEQNAAGSSSTATTQAGVAAQSALDAASAALNANRSPGASRSTWGYNEWNVFAPVNRLPQVDDGTFSYVGGQLRVAGSAHIHPVGLVRLVDGHRYRASVRFRLLSDGNQTNQNTLFAIFFDANGNLTSGVNVVALNAIASTTVAAGFQEIVALISHNGAGGNSIAWPADAASARVMFRTAANVTTEISSIYLEDVEAQTLAQESATASAGSAGNAYTNADLAGQRAGAALGSATAAGTSAGNAKTSADNASTSESNALGSKNAAASSASVAATAKTDAQTAKDQAAGSASAAAGSASAASASQYGADQSASAAEQQATNAQTQAGNAQTYASQASASAGDALGSQQTATSAQGVATTQASNAAGSAGAAAGSASAAGTSANNAGGSASAANASVINAQGYANNANGSAGLAAGSASTASAKADAASGSASTANTQASNAHTHAVNSGTYAGQALTSANNASASAASATAQNTIASSYSSSAFNKNDKFANWPGAASDYPLFWGGWAAGGNYRIDRQAGVGSPYALRTLCDTPNVDGGFFQNVPIHNGRWVMEVTARLDGNNWIGAGCSFAGRWSIDFAKMADSNGLIQTGGVGSTRTWSMMFTINGEVSGDQPLYGMHSWSGFGSTDPRYMTWIMLRVRPANQNEINANKALADSAANSSAISTLQSTSASQVSSLATLTTTVAARALGGGNMLTNTEFVSPNGVDVAGWGKGYTNNPGPDFGINIAGDDWHLVGENALSIHQSGRIGAGYQLWASNRMAVSPGSWIQAYCYMASHRSVTEAVLVWFGGDGAVVSAVGAGASSYAGDNGGKNLQGWRQQGWPSIQVPGNAVAVQLELRKYDTLPGYSDSYAWFSRPYIGLSRQGVTEWSAFAPGNGSAVQNALQANVATIASASADSASKLASARLEFSATTAGGRAGVVIRSDNHAGAGIDLVGDVRIAGNLIVDGTIGSTKVATSAVQQTVFQMLQNSVSIPYG